MVDSNYKLALLHHWERLKKSLGFGEFDLVFKVTENLRIPKFYLKMLVCALSSEPFS